MKSLRGICGYRHFSLTARAAVCGVASETASRRAYCTQTLDVRQPVGGNSTAAVAASRYGGNKATLYQPKCAACGLLQPLRGSEMEAREHTDCTIQDFERKAQELISIMLIICEKRLHSADDLNSPVGNALAEAALAVKAGIRTFVFVERLPDK